MTAAKKIVILGILLTIIEILCYRFTLDLTFKMYPYSWHGVGWGIYTHYSFWWFAVSISIVNLTIATIDKLILTIPIALIIIGVYILNIHSAYDYRPYRVLLREFLMAGLCVISFVVSYFYKLIEKKTMVSSSDFSIK